MNRFDVALISFRYKLTDGRLGRILEHGRVLPVFRLHRGVCFVMLEGKTYKGADVAWALTYGCWPIYPIYLADGDPHNFSARNMLPVRVFPRRCVVTAFQGGFRAARSHTTHPTKEAAMTAWREAYAATLRPMVALTLQEQADALAHYLSTHPRPVMPEMAHKPKWEKANPKSRPSAIEGRKWHYYEGEWLSVPNAVHVSDDYLMRCHAVKYLAADHFRYSASLDQTVVVIGEKMSPAQLREHQATCKVCRHLPIEFT